MNNQATKAKLELIVGFSVKEVTDKSEHVQILLEKDGPKNTVERMALQITNKALLTCVCCGVTKHE